jgi:hypothetical protein
MSRAFYGIKITVTYTNGHTGSSTIEHQDLVSLTEVQEALARGLTLAKTLGGRQQEAEVAETWRPRVVGQ